MATAILPAAITERAAGRARTQAHAHHAADSNRARLREAVKVALLRARKRVNTAHIETAIREHDRSAMDRVVMDIEKTVARELKARVGRVMFETLIESGRQAGAHAKVRGSYRTAALHVAQVTLAFDVTNPRATNWARTESGQLITEISEQTRDAVRGIIGRAFEDQFPPRDAAKLIKQSVGLTSAHAQAVATYAQDLRAADYAESEVRELTDAYAEELLDYRAENIARTETLASAHEGSRQLWLQARDEGLLSGNELREWIVTDDDRLCKICEGMDGQQRAIDEPFVVTYPNGEERTTLIPQAHPQCRCDQVLVVPASAELEAAQGQELRLCVIRHEGDQWCLYTHDGSRKLGCHDTKEGAEAQEAAIQISKHSAARVMRAFLRELAEWNEGDHPRDETGKFSGDGGTGAVSVNGQTLDDVRSTGDSAAINSVPMLHTTNEAAAASIKENGFNFSGNSTHGVGVYFSDQKAGSTYGSSQVEVSLAPHRQLEIDYDTDAPRIFAKIADMPVSKVMFSDDLPARMVEAGYGSARFKVDDQTWTLVFDRSLIKIKEPRTAAEWDESAHPRDETGKFSGTGGAGASDTGKGKPKFGIERDKATQDYKGRSYPIKMGDKPGRLKVYETGADGKGIEHVDAVLSDIVGQGVTSDDLAELAGVVDHPEIAGYRVGMTASGKYGAVEVTFIGVNSSGDEIITWQRTIEQHTYLGEKTLVMKNELFEIKDRDLRGAGLGTESFTQEAETLSRLGFDRIETHAAGPTHGYNGYYTWPRLGYDAPIPPGPRRQHEQDERIRNAERVSDLMKFPEGVAWWKENGIGFDASFDLTPGGASMERLHAYVAAKKGKR